MLCNFATQYYSPKLGDRMETILNYRAFPQKIVALGLKTWYNTKNRLSDHDVLLTGFILLWKADMTTTTVTQLKPYENTLHDRVFCGVCILLCAIMWTSFIHGVYFAIICGNSMVPTLNNGSICVAIQLDAESTMPERGDIVAFYLHPDRDINCVKRVVGLPGDTVLSNNDRLYKRYLYWLHSRNRNLEDRCPWKISFLFRW